MRVFRSHAGMSRSHTGMFLSVAGIVLSVAGMFQNLLRNLPEPSGNPI